MSAATSSRAVALALVAALSGCTLVVQGTSQPVTFTTEPPGASFSYTYTCPPGPTSASTGLPLAGCTDTVGPFTYWSNIGSDLIPPGSDGFGTTTVQRNTNSSLYIGAVYLTP